MIIHFCEKCGNRVPPSQFDSGAAVVMDEVRALCAQCSGKRPSHRASKLAMVPASPAVKESPFRKSDSNAVPAAKKSGLHAVPSPASMPPSPRPSAGHLGRTAARTTVFQGTNNLLLWIGGGVAVLLIVLAGILWKGSAVDRRTGGASPPAKTDFSAATPAWPQPAPLPSEVPATAPVSAVATGPKDRQDVPYDPRAAVAASLLSQAKAQAASDPWAFRQLLESLKDRYARTPAAEEALRLLADWKPPPQRTPPGQDKPRLDGSADTFLTLADAYAWRCGYHGRARDGASFDGNPLRIGTRTFDRGIGMHSPAELNYDLGGHYRWLSGYLGLDAEIEDRGSVKYEIWLDGRKVHETGVLRGRDEAQFFKVPVDGVRHLRIAIGDGGDGGNSDHANLCRLRVSIGAEEPRDDFDRATATVATAPSVPEPVPESSRQRADHPPAAARAEVLALQAQAQFLTGFWGALREKGWALARSRLNDASKDARLAARSDDLKTDAELLALAEKAWAAVPAGATRLTDGRAFQLILGDGKTFALGPGSRTRVVKVVGTTIEIEQDEGRGGKLALNVACEKLAFPCCLELARMGLPDDGETRLALMLMEWLHPQGTNDGNADGRFCKALDEADRTGAPKAAATRLRAWLEIRARERTAEAALRELERLMAEGKGKEAVAFFDALGKEHAATAFWADLQPRLPALEDKLKPFRLTNGLWVSYWTGTDAKQFETFRFAQAETNLQRDFGEGTCDPRIPQDLFGLRLGGLLKIENAGRYAIKSRSDDFMKIWLDGRLILETDCNDRTVELDLQEGFHPLKMQFWEQWGFAFLFVWWKPPGANDFQPIPAEMLWHRPEEMDAYQKP